MFKHPAPSSAQGFQAEQAEHLDAAEQPAPPAPEGFQAEGGEHSQSAPEDTGTEIA